MIQLLLSVAGVWCLFAGALGPGLALMVLALAWLDFTES
jgi:hypothetical protein